MVKQVGEANCVSVVQIAVAYAVNKGIVTILGITKMYQVEEAAKAADIIFNQQEIKMMEDAAYASGVESVQFWESKMDELLRMRHNCDTILYRQSETGDERKRNRIRTARFRISDEL